MLVEYGVIIYIAAFVFMLKGIEHLGKLKTHSIVELLLSAAIWAISLILAINTEVVNNGTIYVFKSQWLLLLSGIMFGTSIILAGLNYVYDFADFGGEIR